MPKLEGKMQAISEKQLVAPLPTLFQTILDTEKREG
jgi:hypothetical protein